MIVADKSQYWIKQTSPVRMPDVIPLPVQGDVSAEELKKQVEETELKEDTHKEDDSELTLFTGANMPI